MTRLQNRSQPSAIKTVLLPTVALALLWSGIEPHDYATWFFELFIGMAGIFLLVAIAPRFRFSTLVYVVVGAHFVNLAIGAKYTYADVPLFNWLRDSWGLSRNHFDRVGHFAQGFTPALVVREVLLRRTQIGRGWLLELVAISTALAFSAGYEILEVVWVLVFYPAEGPEWLGMQNDPYDAQWDMACALCGAITAVVLLSRAQDRAIAALSRTD